MKSVAEFMLNSLILNIVNNTDQIFVTPISIFLARRLEGTVVTRSTVYEGRSVLEKAHEDITAIVCEENATLCPPNLGIEQSREVTQYFPQTGTGRNGYIALHYLSASFSRANNSRLYVYRKDAERPGKYPTTFPIHGEVFLKNPPMGFALRDIP